MPGRAELPDLTSPRELQLYLEQRGLRPRRGWGQNFLIDGNIARKIVDAAALCPGDTVVEIGPGAGALTAILARRGLAVIALEVDRGLADALGQLLRPFPAVRVMQKDALEAEWAELQKSQFGSNEHGVLVSNLPYYISGPLLYQLFRQKFPFKKAVLMLQREVAGRLTAAPGSAGYSALSVFCSYYTVSRALFPVSRHVFWPAPKVDSAVVELRQRSRQLDAGEEAVFWEIVQASFQQRRKMLINSLGSASFSTREELLSVLHQAGIDPRTRAETLTTAQFAKLARITYNCTVEHG